MTFLRNGVRDSDHIQEHFTRAKKFCDRCLETTSLCSQLLLRLANCSLIGKTNLSKVYQFGPQVLGDGRLAFDAARPIKATGRLSRLRIFISESTQADLTTQVFIRIGNCKNEKLFPQALIVITQ